MLFNPYKYEQSWGEILHMGKVGGGDTTYYEQSWGGGDSTYDPVFLIWGEILHMIPNMKILIYFNH